MPVPGVNSTSALVSSEVGGGAGLGQAVDSAIEKHAECAAAISSSGLVLPLASSARAGHDTSYVPMPEDSRVTWPAPSKRLPSQWVLALRVVPWVHSVVGVDFARLARGESATPVSERLAGRSAEWDG